MFDLFFGVALVLFGLPPSGDTIAANGFEVQDVYISTDRPSPLVWTIDSTHHNAAFVTSSSYLNDGKVAVPTRMTWDVGTQTTSAYVKLTASITFTIPANTNFVGAVLFPKTAFVPPPGTLIFIDVDNGLGTLIQVQTATVALNNGSVAAIGVINSSAFVGADFHAVAVHAYIFNAYGSGPSVWATSGQTFDIGEIWFGTLQQFKLATDPKLALIDPTLMRRSHSNQPWPLFLKPYKQWTFNFTPMSNTAAYNSASAPSFDSVRYSLAAANCALVLPRIYTPGTTTINSTDLNQLACFGKPESVGELASVQNANTTGLWRASMVFGEAPP